MAEFKFACPRCRKDIVCDSSYSGTQIKCPVCQQNIAVPSSSSPTVATPGVIKVKLSTLKKVTVIGISTLVLIAVVATAIYTFAGPKTLKFRTFLDGVDVIKLSGNKLWIEHQSWQMPARIKINGKPWSPVWNANTSEPYTLHPAFVPSAPEKVKLSKKAGRGAITVSELPTAANNKTLSITLDDGSWGGADWYEFTVSW